MTATIVSEPLAATLAGLYERAEEQRSSASGPPRVQLPADATAQHRADLMSDRYMPISPDTGTLLYTMIRAARPEVVVEFGTSYGISGLYIAAALRDNGIGHLYTTELSSKKVTAATRNFEQAGVADVVTILPGDARETLASVTESIGIVLLDGWKEMYLPVLALIEPNLRSGATIVADNTTRADVAPYLDYVRDPGNGYMSMSMGARGHDAVEISCRL
ncbi:class I SAM-dependent methyltransferase [Gordonia jinhuaensis]|uniref:O-methyltransferase, family 3 n=1 Tax=Gordonia jinhuaensis TaxID=1517702 RepID=A0A916WS52_9ACTN|nr:class I SAM-dependent methyltransferase [Gordonia jinhuaensis]GGB27605.1 putative O-methyltransferase, family 3 [Gordonia jinhuaensis]